jgi:dephospho-CoA kinase
MHSMEASAPLVVCVIAYSGSGKTFTGDYLAAYHDFAHVDGDDALLNQHLPENKRLSDGLVEARFQHWLPGQDAPVWQPYLRALCSSRAWRPPQQ